MGMMLPCILYLLYPWIFVHGNNSSQSVYDIPEPIYELCSYTDICDRKATRQPEKGYRSCCTPCSCGQDCGLTLDCCFDHLDKYRLVEKGKLACLPSGIGGDLSLFHYYYMIIFCNSTNPLKHHVNGTACRIHENGQSFIAPVSSVNGVYVNAECAECNNIHDYQYWDYIQYIEEFGESVHWNLKRIAIDGDSIFTYLPPVSDTFPTPKLCYDNTQLNTSQYKCNGLLFPRTCQDLNSVFLSSPKNHRNVACALCNTSSALDEFTEYKCSSHSLRHFGSSALTILLDSSAFNLLNLRELFQFDIRESSGKTCRPGSMKSLKTERCLPIYCRESLFYTNSGCKNIYKRWYVSNIGMQLKLSTYGRTSLPVTTIKTLSTQYRSNTNLWMKPPCLGMQTLSVFYENSSLTYVKSFIVLVYKITPNGFSPSEMHSILKSCTENLWKIVIMDKSYTFTANLDRHLHLKDGKTLVDGTESEKLYDEIVDRKRWLFSKYGIPFIARKTFFCNQVILPSDEVEIKNFELRILATNKTLGENEFNRNGSPNRGDYTNVTFAVCVEDYFAHSGVSKLWVNSIYRFVMCSILLLMIV